MVRDERGQASAELILIIGGLLVIILLVGFFISDITDSTQKSLKEVLIKERNHVLNKF